MDNTTHMNFVHCPRILPPAQSRRGTRESSRKPSALARVVSEAAVDVRSFGFDVS